MLSGFTGADKVYIACGYTDLRRGIDGLVTMVQQEFQLDPFTNTLFLFCGRRRDRIKALHWEGNGFVLLYKRLESGSFQWPRKESEARRLTAQQYRWLKEVVKTLEMGSANEQHPEPCGGNYPTRPDLHLNIPIMISTARSQSTDGRYSACVTDSLRCLFIHLFAGCFSGNLLLRQMLKPTFPEILCLSVPTERLPGT